MTDFGDAFDGSITTITDNQAQHMRLVVAGAAINTADARLLMQALGLIPDPLCDRWEISTSRKHFIRKAQPT